jgi:hypothetical protein
MTAASPGEEPEEGLAGRHPFYIFFTYHKEVMYTDGKGGRPLRRSIMSATRRNWAAGFYWTGVAMTVACIALIVVGNTEFAWRLEHTGFPLSWAFAGAAMLAFLAAEVCDYESRRADSEDGSSELSWEWEAFGVEPEPLSDHHLYPRSPALGGYVAGQVAAASSTNSAPTEPSF